jgi:hypothetical protein
LEEGAASNAPTGGFADAELVLGAPGEEGAWQRAPTRPGRHIVKNPSKIVATIVAKYRVESHSFFCKSLLFPQLFQKETTAAAQNGPFLWPRLIY